MAKDADTLKHLEFIQNIITRMNTNSFQIKGWTITIVAATLALYASTKEEYFVLVGILPALIFWFLDANYLTQERRFRGLYDDIAGVSEKPIQSTKFIMNIKPYTKAINKDYWYWDVFISETILPLYFSIIALLTVLFFYLTFININKGVCHG